MGARETALNVLIACRKEKAWSNGVLKEYVIRDRLDSRDAALAARLCYGLQQNRNKLDFYLQQLLTGKLKDLHPILRDILHMGLYQLYEMDKIPESAAVNESVSLAKKYCPKQKFAPGLTNAVLRNAIRSRDNLRQPQRLEDKYSHSPELIALLRKSVGNDRLEGMLKANNTIPPTVIQVNTRKITTEELIKRLEEEQVTVQPHSWMENSLIVSNFGNLEHLSAFRDGLFYVQDPASKLSVLCAQIPQGEAISILDCCAAPGGKSFAAAIAAGEKAHITSCDVHPHKIELIQKGADRLGFANVHPRLQDATQDRPEWHEQMDVVLVDVPCSGYGIIRKKPDIREKSPASMAELPQLQLQILAKQADYVRPGGLLIYSTCTVLTRENADVVNKFLESRSDFSLEALPLPEQIRPDSLGMVTLIPGEYDTDGFFICRLRRKA